MKITEHINPLSERKTYRIIIEVNDYIDSLDLAESFKCQYPNELAVIINSKIKQIEVGMLFVGLK